MQSRQEPTQPRVPMWVYDVGAVLIVLVVGGFFGIFGVRFGFFPAFSGLSHPDIPQGGVPMGQPRGRGTTGDIHAVLWIQLPLLIAAAAVGVRRRWPYLAFAVTGVVCGIAVYFGGPLMGPVLAVTIAIFGLANRTSQKVALISGGFSAAAMIALSFAAKGWASPEPLLLLAATAIAISAALGDSTRSRREFVEAMAKRAEHAEHTREAEAQRRVADERLRIARDLHDTVAHEISVISLNAGVASSALASNPERSEKALATIRSAARGALAEIGELLHYLRDDSALDTAPPRPIVESLPELVARLREGGLAVTMNVTGPLGDITGGVGVVVYRIIQEGLTNAHKHGDGCSAHVTVAVTPGGGGAPGTVHIHIENPVRPPTSSAPHGTPVGSGLGLLGIRERVSTLRGHVSAGQIGAVWVLDAVVPWQRGE